MSDKPVVVLLGAGMGGRGVARALTESAHLVIVDRSAELAQEACAAVEAAGGSAEPASLDLTDLAAVERFRDDLLARLDHVDAVSAGTAESRHRCVGEDEQRQGNLRCSPLLGHGGGSA